MAHSHEDTLDYRRLFKVLPECYVLLRADDPDFTIMDASAAYLKMTGLKLADIRGRKAFDVFPEGDETQANASIMKAYKACIRTKKPQPPEVIRYDIQRSNGTSAKRFWQISCQPMLDKNKQVVALLSQVNDVTEALEADDKLTIAESQLQEALSAGLVGTWVWDIPNDTVITDKSLAKVFGVSTQQAAAGLPLQDFIDSVHSDDRDRVAKLIDRTLKHGKHYEVEYRTIGARGATRWVLARGKLERDNDDKPVRLPGIIFDITARKQAELALLESDDRLRFMADSMPQLVWITRPDGYHEYYNQKWYEYTGTTPDEAEGEGWNSIFHPDDRDYAWKMWRRCLKTGDPYEIEYRLYHAPTDSYRWVIGRALPFKDANGKILKWYGTCTDIDDQKHAVHIQAFLSTATKELTSSLDYEATLERIARLCVPDVSDWCSVDLYDASKDAWRQVAVAHTDPSKVKWAKELRRQYPLRIDTPTGAAKAVRTGKSVFLPVITDKLLAAVAINKQQLKLLRSVGFQSAVTVPIKVQNKPIGAITFVSSDSRRHYTKEDLKMAEELANRVSLATTNAHLFREAQEELMERRRLEKELKKEKAKLESRVKERTKQLERTNEGLQKEIIKRKKTEVALHERSESLARSNQELQGFAYVASHDLQEPLRKIQAFGNLLEDEFGAELTEGHDYLERMRGAAARMSVLIEDLLSFSRVTTKARPLVVVDLNKIVSEVISDLEIQIRDTRGVVTTDDLPTVTADPTQMRQLFQNLISNALKFHKDGVPPRVRVAAKDVDGDNPHHLVTVKDNGIGFDEKYLDRIFSVFQRLHSRESYEGTGIGLAVCRKIVERHGGTITAKSKKDAGAVFGITLPKKTKEKAR